MTLSSTWPLWWLDLLLAVGATALAASLRPWRATGEAGSPWPWLATWAAMPLVWGVDRYVAVPLAQPMSLAPLLVLMAGWPLAVLALPPVAVVTALTAILVAYRPRWLATYSDRLYLPK